MSAALSWPRSSDPAIRVTNPLHTRIRAVVTRLCVPKRGATREIELPPVSALMLTPHKRAGTVRSFDVLLKWSLPGCHHPGTWTGGQVCPPKGIEFHCSIAGGFALLVLARIQFVLKRNSSPMFSLNIGGTMATVTATVMPWCKPGTHSSITLNALAVRPG